MDGECPNCGQSLAQGVRDGCILEALGGVLQDRLEADPQAIAAFIETYDNDLLWEKMGRIVDEMERDFKLIQAVDEMEK